MAEDPQYMTLQQRIAALNVSQVGRINGDSSLSSLQHPPRVPSGPPLGWKQKVTNVPTDRVNGHITDVRLGSQPIPPPLPARKQPPPLPSRKMSQEEGHQHRQGEEEERRGSVASISSAGTTDSAAARRGATRTKSIDSNHRVKAPAWGECELPVLPPKGTTAVTAPRKSSEERPKYANRLPSGTTTGTPAATLDGRLPASRPSLPPRIPSRKPQIEHHDHGSETALRKVAPVPTTEVLERAKNASFSSAVDTPTPVQETIPEQGVEEDPDPLHSGPPPIPLLSRPDLSAIQGTKPKFPIATSGVNGSTVTLPLSSGCLICRDFSGPDHHARLFPRSQVTSLQALAQQLTAPFLSPTDKARAIFTWLHHNIAYDVVSFFGGTVRDSTPLSTLQTGLAVCEGYAALFTTLAGSAGLDAIVVSGHGKGYGFQPLAPGSRLPAYNAGHAWNAVKVDNGEWKLIDACWGAGYVQGPGRPYVPKFNPDYFSMSNEQFAVKHFPGNQEYFFLPGGRRMSWEEYIQIDPAKWPDAVEGPTVFTNAKEDYGIGEKTFLPKSRKISVHQGGVVRFQFGLLCPHWTLDRHTQKGLPPVFIVSVGGPDGRSKDHIPMEHLSGNGGGGDLWYVDIPARDLGAPGQTVTLFSVASFGSRQDARGLTVREFVEGKGRVGMGFTGVAAWDLV